MADLPVFPRGADDPDGGGYKGRRADQDAAASAVPAAPESSVAPDPLGGVASPAAAPGQPVDPVGQSAAFGSTQSPPGHTPWGGPAYDPVGSVGSAGQADPAGQVNPVGQGAAGYGSDGGPVDGPEYALGAVYGPGVGAPAGAMPADPSLPAGYASPTDSNHTSLAAAGGQPAGAAATVDPGVPTGEPVPPTQPASAIAPDISTGPPTAVPVTDDVSFHPANLDAVLSGRQVSQPVAPPVGESVAPPAGQPTGQPVAPPGSPTGAGGGTDDGSGQDIRVSVDGTVVSSGDGGVRVNVGPDGTTQVTGDPAQAAADPRSPAVPVGSGPPDHGSQTPPEQSGQPGQPGQPGGAGQSGPADGGGADARQGPGQLIHGAGADPANVELTVDRDTLGDVPVEVIRNADGSLDVHLPAGVDGHDVDVHVPHGRDADITLSRDHNGDLLVRATPDTGGDNRAGGGPGDPADPADPASQSQTGRDGSAGPTGPVAHDGADHPASAADDAQAGGTGGPPAPAGGGSPAGGGAPGGAPPNPTTGGPPVGGPSGDGPSGGGSNSGTVKADPQAITQLGSDLTGRAGPMLDSAHQKAGNISVSFPGFGVLGLPLNMAHDQVRQTAQSYLAAGRSQLDSWRTALNQTATNYRDAEDSSTISDG